MIKVVCEKCGYVLYEGMFIGEIPAKRMKTVSFYEWLNVMYNGKCPNCGRKLPVEPKKIVIKTKKSNCVISFQEQNGRRGKR